MTVEYKNLPVEELSAFEIRDIRIDVLEKLKDRISKGYNPARPLTVVKTDNKYDDIKIFWDGEQISKARLLKILMFEDEDISSCMQC